MRSLIVDLRVETLEPDLWLVALLQLLPNPGLVGAQGDPRVTAYYPQQRGGIHEAVQRAPGNVQMDPNTSYNMALQQIYALAKRFERSIKKLKKSIEEGEDLGSRKRKTQESVSVPVVSNTRTAPSDDWASVLTADQLELIDKLLQAPAA